jgi:hypothetical protein
VGPSILVLNRIAKVADLVGTAQPREASGVIVHDGRLMVISDNTGNLAILDPGLTPPGREVRLDGGLGRDYEDLAADPAGGRLFVVVEELPGGPPFHALVEEYDDNYRLVASKQLDTPFRGVNKGIEGLAALRHDGQLFLLGLGEADDGRLGVYIEGADRWTRVARIQLPHRFEDYAGVAVAGDRIAVVSQQSSALWLGHFDPSTWTVDEGVVYNFPRDDDGKPRFEAVEGVAFLGADQVVVATDRRSLSRHPDTEQSVAVFDLPNL